MRSEDSMGNARKQERRAEALTTRAAKNAKADKTYAKVPIRVGLVLLFWPFVMLGAETSAPALTTKWVSKWADVEEAMGAMNLDGTLRLSYPLCDQPELKRLGFVLELRHGVEVDAQGRARTVWLFRGLQSSLVPSGRERLRWRVPSGASVEFERAKIEAAFSGAGSKRWLIRESGSAEYEIRSAEGRTWRYRSGQWVGIDDPALGGFSVTTQGALLHEVRRIDGLPQAAALLRATYDEEGRLLTLALGSAAPHYFTWDEQGQLSSWQKTDGRVMHFHYCEGLLVEIVEPDTNPQVFVWAQNPGYGRGDSRWAAPVHLSAKGTDTYGYSLSAKGFTLWKKGASTDEDVVTVFNPRRRRVEQRAGGKTVIVTFRGGTLTRGALEKIETGQGELLEIYRYDERGQLIGVKRLGEPERMLSYDDEGRLMAMEEKL